MVRVSVILVGMAAAVKHSMEGPETCGCVVGPNADPPTVIACLENKSQSGACESPEVTDYISYADGGLCVASDGYSAVYSLGGVTLSHMVLQELAFVSTAVCDPGKKVTLEFGTGYDCSNFEPLHTVTDLPYMIFASSVNGNTFNGLVPDGGDTLITPDIEAVRLSFGPGCTIEPYDGAGSATWLYRQSNGSAAALAVSISLFTFVAFL